MITPMIAPLLLPTVANSGGLVIMIELMGLFGIVAMFALVVSDRGTDRNIIVIPVVSGLIGGLVVAILGEVIMYFIASTFLYSIFGIAIYLFIKLLEKMDNE